MSAKEQLEIIHTVDGAALSNSYGKSVITSEVIGLIYLPTGEIIMGDPTRRYGIEDFKRKAFARRVEPGIYDVIVYTAQSGKERNLAFAEIRFSDQKPVFFVAAKTIYDTENKRRGVCGYIVHDAITGFMDAEVFRTICAQPRFSYPPPLSFEDLPEERIDSIRCGIGAS